MVLRNQIFGLCLISSMIIINFGCKKEQEISVSLPVVETEMVTKITDKTAVVLSRVVDAGNGTILVRGICWDTQTTPTLVNNVGHTTNDGGTGAYVSDITGLSFPQHYYVCSYATNEEGTSYGEIISFETFLCGVSQVEYGAQTYNTVQIENQCWMRENLNIGVMIDGGFFQTDDNIIEKYCFGSDETNCDEYGGLYGWHEMMQYITEEGTQGICPNGWHIPTDGEWTNLANFLGGDDYAGGKMKEAGTDHWDDPNTGATNSSGFTALPGGYHGSSGNSFGLGDGALFWSSSDTGGGPWNRIIYYNESKLIRYKNSWGDGLSVRCLRN